VGQRKRADDLRVCEADEICYLFVERARKLGIGPKGGDERDGYSIQGPVLQWVGTRMHKG
jgi:hypothetical protein